jgi:hypothetical protein
LPTTFYLRGKIASNRTSETGHEEILKKVVANILKKDTITTRKARKPSESEMNRVLFDRKIFIHKKGKNN